MIKLGKWKGMKSINTPAGLAPVFVLIGLLLASCFGSPAFEPGDQVEIPPLPAADPIIGFFSKFKVEDMTGTIYALKDLPVDSPTAVTRVYPSQPSLVFFQNEFLLYFLLTTEDKSAGGGITAALKKATMQPASPYISTGPDGVADSGVGGDDLQAIPGGATGLSSNFIVIGPGGNALLDTNVPRGSDDAIMRAIAPGADRLPNTVAAGDDVPMIDIILPGPNSTFDSILSGDDVDGGFYYLPGLNAVLDTSLGGDDIQFTLFVTAGPNGVIDSAPGGDDVIADVLTAGPDGIVQSGITGNDAQGVSVGVGGYTSFIGIPGTKGEPNRIGVNVGLNAIIDTPCIFDDNLRLKDGFPSNATEHVPLSDGIHSGLDGIMQSGLGGDDIQLYRAGAPVIPRATLILPGANGLIETIARGGTDTQTLAPGSVAANPNVPVVDAGPDGSLETCPAGDDFVAIDTTTGIPMTQILAGNNKIAETLASGDDTYAALDGGDSVSSSGLGGDDYQILSQGINSPQGFTIPVVSSGPNGILETPVSGDEVVGIYHTEWFPAGGSLNDCTPPASTCAIAESGLGGDDAQVIAGGVTGLSPTDVVVSAGSNAILETQVALGDVIVGTDIQAGQNGVAESGVWGDDLQVANRGEASLLYLDTQPPPGPDTPVPFPVVLPGANGVLETPVAAGDNLVIIEYGVGNDAGMEGAINALYGLGLPPGFLPDGNGKVDSGLGGRGIFDAMYTTCSTGVLDNGGVFGDDPYINNPPLNVCLPRPAGCPDDCQAAPYGAAVGPTAPIIIAGQNQVFDTTLLGDDAIFEAVVDGGNGLSESGLGGDDFQTIGVGQGQPFAVSVIAGTNSDGSPRMLETLPAGDDSIVFPELVPDLSGDGYLTKDDAGTVVDPDGDGRIENYATVDDGEYFSWENTDITNDFIGAHFRGMPDPADPPTSGVVDDVQVVQVGTSCALSPNDVAIDPGPNGRLETVAGEDDIVNATGDKIMCGSNGKSNTIVDRRGLLSQHMLVNPANPGELLVYLSNGRNFYLTRSVDGVSWDPVDPNSPVLRSASSGRASDPVVLSGMDGICETVATSDDVQGIAPGYGLPNTIALSAGQNKIVDSIPQGDDYVAGVNIFTGANGIRETQILGDDWENIPLGRGEADSACVFSGPNGRRDTPDSSLGASSCAANPSGAVVRNCSSDTGVVGDDRPPFEDRNGAYTRLGRNSANFDAVCDPATATTYGAECPWLPEFNERSVELGGWAGFNSLGIDDPYVFYFDGLYYMYYTALGAQIEPTPLRPNIFSWQILGPCPRAGLNGVMDSGVATSVLNADNNGSVVVAKRIGVATSLDGVNWTSNPDPAISPGTTCGSATDIGFLLAILGDVATLGSISYGSTVFDYNGASAPFVQARHAEDGSPLFAILYTGNADTFNSFTPETSGEGNFTGTKNGVGIAMSFDGIAWSKLDDENPVFIGGLLGSSGEESQPDVHGVPDGFLMYYHEHDTDTNGNYIAVAGRFGTVFPACLSVARSPFATSANMGVSVCFVFLLFLPAFVLIGRRIYKRAKGNT